MSALPSQSGQLIDRMHKSASCQTAKYAPQQKRRYSITSSAEGSPEKQKINDEEGCDYATGAEGEHVANVVSGHALARLDCSFDDPFVMPFRHQGLSLLR